MGWDAALRSSIRIGWMEGDGGLTDFTTRCSGRVVKGLVELLQLFKRCQIALDRLAAVRAGAARKRGVHDRQFLVRVGHML